MRKTVYLIRHSIPLKLNNDFNNESLQLQNEKNILSIEGDELARKKLVNDELTNLDLIISSSYTRAIGTAKYLTINNDKEIIILPNFGERKFGINNWDELPKDFYQKQFLDNDYKMPNGESINEVRNRMYNELSNLLNKNYNRIAIVSHSKSMESLLGRWCDITIKELDVKTIDKTIEIDIKFKNKCIKINNIENCMIFKLEFEDKELIDINVIK